MPEAGGHGAGREPLPTSHRWIQRYGFEEVSVGKPDDDALEDWRNSRRRSYRKVVREKPGLVAGATGVTEMPMVVSSAAGLGSVAVTLLTTPLR